MIEKKVMRENYILIQGWMLTDLKLKGNELIIYSCIYGFSQAENQVFNGSLKYLADWTNSSKQSVIKCLKSLEQKGYIVKNENYINGIKFCEYYSTKLNTLVNKVEYPSKQSLTGGGKQSLPNNKDLDKIKEIIEYLNSVAERNFKYTTAESQKHIRARLRDGFVVDDFKKVIDNKCASWQGTEYEQYLRPETLFGAKFESYLNEKPKPKKKDFYEILKEINI